MEKFTKEIIEEYKKTGYINVYFIGQEGSGKTILLFQVYNKLCEELNIKPNLEGFDFNKQILSQNGLNLIESYKDSNLYDFKVKVLLNRTDKGIQRGFCEYSIKDKKFKGKFLNKNIFYNEYLEKKKEFLEKSYMY